MVTKRRTKRKQTRVRNKLTPEQKRNSDIFRLRGFYANAKTLPFSSFELKAILNCVDGALLELGAETHTDYMKRSSSPTKMPF